MRVTMKMSALLRNATGQQEPFETDAATPFDCLKELVGRFPKLESWLFDEDGGVKRQVWVLVNDERIYPDEFARPLKDGDEVSVLLAVLGG